MPVQAATRVNRSTGNGVTTVFPYTFKLISQSHIRVTVDGVVKTITTDYTVSGVGDAGGGNVTFTTAPANLAAVVLSGSAPYSRSTDYVRNGSFQEETVDNDFDLAVILIQQIDERQGRAIAIPIDDATGTDVELPVAADRASKYLAFDADGNPVASSGTPVADIATPFAETLLDDTTAAKMRNTLGVDGYEIAASVASGALTVNIVGVDGNALSATNKLTLRFNNYSTSGAIDEVEVDAPLTLTIPNTAVMGASNSVPFRLWLVAFNDAGTVRLGVINCLSGELIYKLRQRGSAASSTILDTNSDSAHVFYTEGASVTARRYVVLGHMHWNAGLAAAGVWSLVPTSTDPQYISPFLPGDIVQRHRTTSGAVATGTTVTPLDDTIPQITEGDQVASLGFIPTAEANLLRCRFEGHFAHSVAGTTVIVAGFKDTAADAIRAAASFSDTADKVLKVSLEYVVPIPFIVTTVTTKIRAGGSQAGTLTYNGAAAGRLLGGVLASFLEVEEIFV